MKKEIIKSIVNVVLSAITAILTIFGLAGCTSLDFECSGNWCVKKVVK